MSDSAVELLQRAAAGEAIALPSDLACQLLAAANDTSLAECLGLTRHQRVRLRNAALVEAARILSPGSCSTWHTANLLEQAMRRFERALLPALRAGRSLALTPPEAALWRAYQLCGTRMLRARRKLYDLLLLED